MTQADRIEQKLVQLLAIIDQLLAIIGQQAPSPAIKDSAARLIELARINPRASIEEAKRIARADSLARREVRKATK
jgi:hypothetical protein